MSSVFSHPFTGVVDNKHQKTVLFKAFFFNTDKGSNVATVFPTTDIYPFLIIVNYKLDEQHDKQNLIRIVTSNVTYTEKVYLKYQLSQTSIVCTVHKVSMNLSGHVIRPYVSFRQFVMAIFLETTLSFCLLKNSPFLDTPSWSNNMKVKKETFSKKSANTHF